jgi:hypothetical protein
LAEVGASRRKWGMLFDASCIIDGTLSKPRMTNGRGRIIVQIKQRDITFREYWGSLCTDGNLLYKKLYKHFCSKSCYVYLFIEQKGKTAGKKYMKKLVKLIYMYLMVYVEASATCMNGVRSLPCSILIEEKVLEDCQVPSTTNNDA